MLTDQEESNQDPLLIKQEPIGDLSSIEGSDEEGNNDLSESFYLRSATDKVTRSDNQPSKNITITTTIISPAYQLARHPNLIETIQPNSQLETVKIFDFLSLVNKLASGLRCCGKELANFKAGLHELSLSWLTGYSSDEVIYQQINKWTAQINSTPELNNLLQLTEKYVFLFCDVYAISQKYLASNMDVLIDNWKEGEIGVPTQLLSRINGCHLIGLERFKNSQKNLLGNFTTIWNNYIELLTTEQTFVNGCNKFNVDAFNQKISSTIATLPLAKDVSFIKQLTTFCSEVEKLNAIKNYFLFNFKQLLDSSCQIERFAEQIYLRFGNVNFAIMHKRSFAILIELFIKFSAIQKKVLDALPKNYSQKMDAERFLSEAARIISLPMQRSPRYEMIQNSVCKEAELLIVANYKFSWCSVVSNKWIKFEDLISFLKDRITDRTQQLNASIGIGIQTKAVNWEGLGKIIEALVIVGQNIFFDQIIKLENSTLSLVVLRESHYSKIANLDIQKAIRAGFAKYMTDNHYANLDELFECAETRLVDDAFLERVTSQFTVNNIAGSARSSIEVENRLSTSSSSNGLPNTSSSGLNVSEENFSQSDAITPNRLQSTTVNKIPILSNRTNSFIKRHPILVSMLIMLGLVGIGIGLCFALPALFPGAAIAGGAVLTIKLVSIIGTAIKSFLPFAISPALVIAAGAATIAIGTAIVGAVLGGSLELVKPCSVPEFSLEDKSNLSSSSGSSPYSNPILASKATTQGQETAIGADHASGSPTNPNEAPANDLPPRGSLDGQDGLERRQKRYNFH